jgi:hypothetical protein
MTIEIRVQTHCVGFSQFNFSVVVLNFPRGFDAALGICTDLQFNERVARTEQCDPSPNETCGVASIVFNPEG